MSTIQWITVIVLGTPVALYICATFAYGYVRATTWNEPDHATPPKRMFRKALLFLFLLVAVVWAIIPIGEWVYYKVKYVRVDTVATLDSGAWWHVRFERDVECTGDLLLMTRDTRSQPSPDCDGNPKRDLRFNFREGLREGAQIIKIEVRPGAAIQGANGERVDLSIK